MARLLTRDMQPGLVSPGGGDQAQWYSRSGDMRLQISIGMPNFGMPNFDSVNFCLTVVQKLTESKFGIPKFGIPIEILSLMSPGDRLGEPLWTLELCFSRS